MSKLHIFVDGSWLFKACAPERALAHRLEYPERAFKLSFPKLCEALLAHVRAHDDSCVAIGDRHLSTSVFALPDDLDEWPSEREDVTDADIENVRKSVAARERFIDGARAAGFDPAGVYHPPLKGWMLEKLRTRRFQEKQVDATVIALLVRSAITCGEDYHAILTGDADVLPAIKVAYPAYSENVFLATTHPDQLRAEARQTSFALADFETDVPPHFLDEHAESLLDGDHVYKCGHCGRVFSRQNPIPSAAKPCCKPCHEKRT